MYGARPLKRTIQQFIENPLSMEILKGDITEASLVKADVEGNKITFDIAPIPADEMLRGT